MNIPRAAIDDNDHKGAVVTNSITTTQALPLTGLSLTNSNPAHVALVDGSGSQITSFGGGTQYAEGATTSPATGTLSIGRYDATPPTLADGALYGLQLDINGALITSGGGGGTQYAVGTVAGATDTGTLGLVVRDDALTTLSDPDGDYVQMRVTSVGRLWTSTAIDTALPAGANIIGAVTQSGTWNINTVTSITNAVTVQATNLDIRDLTFASDKVDASGSTLGANSGVDIGDVTINNAAGASAVNIQDGGNSITVDGTVSITANSAVNIAQVAGTTTSVDSGTADNGTQRVVQATSATPTLSNVASSATSVTLLSAATARISATLYNDSTQDVRIKYGTTASATDFTWYLPSYGTLYIDDYNGRIDAIWLSANGNMRITELT